MACLKYQLVIYRVNRFHQEQLYPRTCFLAEMHARLNHLGVVEHHQGSLRQIIGKMKEGIFAHHTFIIYKELALVALRHRKAGNTVVGKGIVIIANSYMLCIHIIMLYLISNYYKAYSPLQENGNSTALNKA